MSVLPQWVDESMVMRLGWALIAFVPLAAALALALAGTLQAMATQRATRRYALASAALLLMAACPVISLLILSGDFARADPDTSGIALVRRWVESFLPDLVICWVVGVGAMSLRLLIGWGKVQRIRRNANRIVGGAPSAHCCEMARRLGMTRAVPLLETGARTGPAVVGIRRPQILCPSAALNQLAGGQIEGILAHELAHIRRLDYLANLLQSAIETLLFFHPAIWWATGIVRQEREDCCDDVAVEACGDYALYASALADLGALSLGASWRLAPAARSGSLLRRIRRILQIHAPRNARGRISYNRFGRGARWDLADYARSGGGTSTQVTQTVAAVPGMALLSNAIPVPKVVPLCLPDSLARPIIDDFGYWPLALTHVSLAASLHQPILLSGRTGESGTTRRAAIQLETGQLLPDTHRSRPWTVEANPLLAQQVGDVLYISGTLRLCVYPDQLYTIRFDAAMRLQPMPDAPEFLEPAGAQITWSTPTLTQGELPAPAHPASAEPAPLARPRPPVLPATTLQRNRPLRSAQPGPAQAGSAVKFWPGRMRHLHLKPPPRARRNGHAGNDPPKPPPTP